MASISIDDIVNAIGKQTQSVNPLLWAVVEPYCKSKFAPRYLALSAQLKPEDRLEVKGELERIKVGGREMNNPVGITYSVVLNKPDKSEKIVYSLNINLVGQTKETGSELLYND